MKINIAASHRFHLLDLARELSKQGHQVTFYSYVPKKRIKSFGLDPKNAHSLLLITLPFLFFAKISKYAEWSVKVLNIVLDLYVTTFMKPCDVFIGLGTVYFNAFKKAKNRYNATTILEWGSKHIYEQEDILNKIGKKRQNPYFINRAIYGYNITDFIAISSDHVRESFFKYGISQNKLLQNPYGVDLDMFKATQLTNPSYDVIMVGGWMLRKGCDLIADFFNNSELSFLHVGPVIDLKFPKCKNMTHIDPVNQKELINYYKKAKIFILPSREEGLAMVQVQALVCGLPIVCSKDSGGKDLRNFLSDKKWIIEMNSLNINELERCIFKALEYSKELCGERNYAKGDIKKYFSWQAYGERYNYNLKKIIK